MSKLYQKYLELKSENEEKYYLFRCGNFYIFLGEDAKRINDYAVLKITYFSKETDKCGFPANSLENYMKVFKNQNLDIEIIENTTSPMTNEERAKKIINKISKIDIESITPLEALNELAKLKEIIDGE